MAVYLMTKDAKSLLKGFDERIEQVEPEGKITTWEKSSDGKYYTHKSTQWSKLAWFKPVVCEDRLRFNIIRPKDKNISVTVYGYYHGHRTRREEHHARNLAASCRWLGRQRLGLVRESQALRA